MLEDGTDPRGTGTKTSEGQAEWAKQVPEEAWNKQGQGRLERAAGCVDVLYLRSIEPEATIRGHGGGERC